MARRRMFSLDVVDTDAFLEMPASSQNLYFHLGMRADDDGFISNPKKIMRIINSNDDDLKILLTKRFVLGFQSGIIVIKHWKINNYLQKDRYKMTLYTEEKELITVKKNGSYTECIHDVYNSDTQVRLGKDRLGKDSIDKDKLSLPDKKKSSKKNVKKDGVKISYRENVYLSEKEYHTLQNKYNQKDIEKALDKLSFYKMSKNKKYSSDYGAMNTWVFESINAIKINNEIEVNKYENRNRF